MIIIIVNGHSNVFNHVGFSRCTPVREDMVACLMDGNCWQTFTFNDVHPPGGIFGTWKWRLIQFKSNNHEIGPSPAIYLDEHPGWHVWQIHHSDSRPNIPQDKVTSTRLSQHLLP